MFIKNIKTGMIHEVINEDVIRQCSKDDNYIVSDTREGLNGAGAVTENAIPDAEEVEEITESEEENAPQEDMEKMDYSSMTVKELREIAKDKGIQGYKNMNKDTLIAVIEAH